jgi:RNA polymerase sigma factor (sigma-70 family)
MGEQRTDGQLLEHFISRRDETAFEALLRRHGPMVRGVCRRILGDVHDADDAFQATFLVLVRKAASVRPREAVGNFLYGVAYRTALEARRRMARRRAREMPLPNVPQPESESDDRWQELCPLLDREINRLSEKYRLPVVLCELEGRSRKEVARQLAIPEGTLSSRLTTARKKLATRLARYGLVFSGTSLAALLAKNTASACVPAALSGATLKAAMLVAAGPAALGVVSTTVTTLTEGVLKAMFIAKIKTATIVLCGVTALGVGTGGVVYQTRAGAADPQKVERGVQGQLRPTTEADQEKNKWRRIAEEAQSREEALREELRKAHQELEKLRMHVEAQQRERDHLKEIYARMKIQNEQNAQITARQRAEGTRVGRQNHLPHQDANRPADRKPDLKADLDKLEVERDLLLRKHKELSEQLKKQLAELDQREVQIELQMKKIQMELTAKQPNPNASQKPPGGDKLDQILERLERLEKRLDRLERNKPEPNKP